MKRSLILILTSLLICNITIANDTDTLYLDLRQTIKLATDSSLTKFRCQNMLLTGFWDYKTYKARRLPSLSLDLTPVEYNNYFSKRYDSENDLDIYRKQQTFGTSGGFSISQNFDLLGGTFYIDSELGYLKNFGELPYAQFSTIPIRIGYQQNLLGFNAFKWERKIEPIKYEKIKREFIYNMEILAEEAIGYFFDLAMAQADYDLAKENLASCDTIYRIGLNRQQIASISQADLLTLELESINARNTLKSAEIALKRARFAFLSYLDLDKSKEIKLIITHNLHTKIINTESAIDHAKENNPTLFAHRITLMEAERDVRKAKVESIFNANLNVSMGFNQVDYNFANAYRKPLKQNIISVSLSIPILDWGIRKGQLKKRESLLNIAKISAKQDEISLEEDIIITVNEFNSQQQLVSSAEYALKVAELACEQTRQRFITGKSDVNSLMLAYNRQQTAHKNYLDALRNYWRNYHKIRRLTLYDFNYDCSLLESFDIIANLFN